MLPRDNMSYSRERKGKISVLADEWNRKRYLDKASSVLCFKGMKNVVVDEAQIFSMRFGGWHWIANSTSSRRSTTMMRFGSWM